MGRRATAAIAATLITSAPVGATALHADAAVTDQVDYIVGGDEATVGLHVWFERHRNGSCSVSRNYRNDFGVPVRVLTSMTWDGNLAHTLPKPGTSALDGDDVLAAGQQETIVFTNHDHIPNAAPGMFLHITVTLPGEVGVIGAHSEPIEACVPDDTTDTTASSTTSSTDTTSTTFDTTTTTGAPEPPASSSTIPADSPVLPADPVTTTTSPPPAVVVVPDPSPTTTTTVPVEVLSAPPLTRTLPATGPVDVAPQAVVAPAAVGALLLVLRAVLLELRRR
jgi:hypothetical protein